MKRINCFYIDDNIRYRYQFSMQCIMVAYWGRYAMIRDLILLHVEDVSLKGIKRWFNDHLLNDVPSPIYYQNALRRMQYRYCLFTQFLTIKNNTYL